MRPRAWSTIAALLALLAVAAQASAAPDLRAERDHPLRPTVLVWGVELFTRKADVETWLRGHGGQSYASWARQHPEAVSVLAAAAHPLQFRRSQMAPTKSPLPPPSARAPSPTQARAPSSEWQLAVLLVVAAVLLVAAALPVRLVRTTPLVSAYDDRRWLIGAAGSAILVGVVAAALAH